MNGQMTTTCGLHQRLRQLLGIEWGENHDKTHIDRIHHRIFFDNIMGTYRHNDHFIPIYHDTIEWGYNDNILGIVFSWI